MEKARLDRFQKLYDETKDVTGKIELNDRIFNLERRIKYLEDALRNKDLRVDYSTVTATITEKQSGYAGIAFVKFSELVRRLVSSINSLLTLVFVIAPYAVAALVIWIGVRLYRKWR